MTWTRSGSFTGSWTGDEGYFNSRQILKSLKKRNVGELADMLVVELDGWESKKTQTYKEAGKHVIAAESVYEFITEEYPEVLL